MSMKKVTLLLVSILCGFALLAQKKLPCTVEYENGNKQNYFFNGKLVNIFGFDYKSTLILTDLSSNKIKVNVEDIKEIIFHKRKGRNICSILCQRLFRKSNWKSKQKFEFGEITFSSFI